MSTLTKKDVVFEWTMLDHGMIKFKDGTDDVYEASDAVKEFIKSSGKLNENGEVLENTKASVEINPDDGDIGKVEKVVFSSESTPETPKETTKQEATPEVQGDSKQYTVKGVSVQKKCLTFYETEGTWFNIDDSLDVNSVKEMQKAKVEVVIEKTDGKSYDLVKSIKVVEDKTEKQQPKNDFKTSTNKDSSVQRSIEAQASLNSACQVASRICQDQDSEDIKKFIHEIAINNFNIIQELKNS